ncbi:B12-binding domain-containing radical SAM protein (plasmid) [Rhizobium acidisoli]|uniref:B12-binding domain-containing radical SAM protein n=1 Tax=Rhizobium acidisoli TaxID=1538158 RepID=A0AAE5U158_9HYPH|nr:radical SAM protein [Rhizobium acidisoli]QAS80891.1 B12-binding domain-containing radical SAM protein [Rhizobium acidisoli]
MVDLAFISPPTPSPAEHSEYSVMAPPLGIGYLAAMLRNAGHTVEAIDLAVSHNPVPDMIDFLRRTQPKIMGFYLLTQNYYLTQKLLKLAKVQCPDTIAWAGGPHVSYEYEHALRGAGFDVVFIFEAEYSSVEVANVQLRGEGKLKNIAGIAFLEEDGTLIKTPTRERERTLDALPYPARDLFSINRYLRPGTIMSSRGCPLKCIFCVASTFEDAYRYRSPENVFGEIKHMYNTWGVNDFYFVDNVFTTHRGRARKIAQMIRESGLPVGWYCVSRVDYVTPQLMQDLASGNCYRIELGVESADLGVIDNMKKHIKIDQVRRAADIILNLGMQPMFTFQVGHPDDTPKSMEATIKLMREMREQGAGTYLSITTPYPGTPLYLGLEKYGVTLETQDWEDYRWSNPTYSTKNFKRDYLRRAVFEEAQALTEAIMAGKLKDPPSAPWLRFGKHPNGYVPPRPSNKRDPGTLRIEERQSETPSRTVRLPVLQIKRDSLRRKERSPC